MKFPKSNEALTLADIEEMKARAYEPATIRAAQEHYERGQEALELCRVIDAAFSDVTLGGGVGLYEAQGLDDYADPATCAAYRAKDEKEDWRLITSEDLCRCNSSLSFFDAEGMRFHLPAYLTCDLRGEYRFGMAFCLAYLYEGYTDRFSLLSKEQRIAVRLFLLCIIHDPDYDDDRPHIERALDEYWTWPSEPMG